MTPLPRSRGAPIRSISAVLPAHNVAADLMPVVAETLDALLDVVPSFEVIVVDDGSTDGTRRIAEEMAATHPAIRVLHFAQRRGYGVAWREGLAAATKQYAFFVDPDRQYSPSDLERLVKWDDAYDIVAGFRAGKGTSLARRFAGYAYRVTVRILYGLKYRDVNCGLKLMRVSLLRGLELEGTTGAIHAEVLCRASQKGAQIREVGVRFHPRAPAEPETKRFRLALRFARELGSLRAALVRERRQAALETRARQDAEKRIAASTDEPTASDAARRPVEARDRAKDDSAGDTAAGTGDPSDLPPRAIADERPVAEQPIASDRAIPAGASTVETDASPSDGTEGAGLETPSQSGIVGDSDASPRADMTGSNA